MVTKLSYKKRIKKSTFFSICLVVLLNSCTSKYLVKVDAETKTKFGFEITEPYVAVFFVENVNSKIGLTNIDQHNKIADRMYNKYGPARDDFFIAKTNAKDFKFNLKNVSYYIVVQKLPQRTAMIIFDGKHRPKVYSEPEKYEEIIKKIKNEV